MGGCNLKSKEEEEIGGCENAGGCGSKIEGMVTGHTYRRVKVQEEF